MRPGIALNLAWLSNIGPVYREGACPASRARDRRHMCARWKRGSRRVPGRGRRLLRRRRRLRRRRHVHRRRDVRRVVAHMCRGNGRRLHRRRPLHRRRVRPGDRRMRPSGGDRRHPVRGRRRLHGRRHVRARELRAGHAGRLHRARSVPRRRHVRFADGTLLDAADGRRHPVRGRRRVHDRRHVPRGKLHAGSARRVQRPRPVSRRGHVRPVDGRLLQSGHARRDGLRRRRRVHGRRHVRGRTLRRGEARPMRRAGPVPRRGYVQPGDRRVLQSCQSQRQYVHRR